MTASIDRRSLLGAGAAGAAALGLGTGAKAKTVLAPGVKKADFAGAVAAMRKVVGDEWVFADPAAVTPWKKSYTPDPYGKHVPVGAVCPQSVEEVQAIVKIANKYKIPLYPISTGKIEELIHELKSDYTVVIVTHNMQQAARCSDYTAYMYLGDLIEFGPTGDLFMKPKHKDTEDYITGRFG